MPINLIEADLLRVIDEKVKKRGIRATAREMKISASYLCDIHKRRRNISEEFALKLGYIRERIVIISFRKM